MDTPSTYFRYRGNHQARGAALVAPFALASALFWQAELAPTVIVDRREDLVVAPVDELRPITRLEGAAAFILGALMMPSWAVRALLLTTPVVALVALAADLNSGDPEQMARAKRRMGLALTEQEKNKIEEKKAEREGEELFFLSPLLLMSGFLARPLLFVPSFFNRKRRRSLDDLKSENTSVAPALATGASDSSAVMPAPEVASI